MNSTTNPLKPKYSWFGNTEKTLRVGGKTLQYLITLITVAYLLGLLFVISNDKKALDENYLMYMFALITPMLFMFLVILSNARSSNVLVMMALCTVILILFFAYMYFPNFSNIMKTIYLSWFDFEKIPGFSEEASFMATLLVKVLIIGIIVVGMSLFYNLFLNQSYRQEGMIGFLIYFIFFIPCLFDDFLRFLFKEFQTTPNIVFVLFILEIIFLIAYFYIPANILKNSLAKGKILIEDPLFLGTEHRLANSEILLKKNDPDMDKMGKSSSMVESKVYNRNYAISLWLSYNPLQVHKDDARPIPLFRLNLTETGSKDVQEIFNKYDTANEVLDATELVNFNNDPSINLNINETMNFDEFKSNFSNLNESEIQEIFNKYDTADGVLDATEFNNFKKDPNIKMKSNIDSIEDNNTIDFNRFKASVGNIGGIPCLTYLHDDTFEVIVTNNFNKETDAFKYKTQINLLPQRWNNIVFNYHNSHMDLFVNGILERTFPLNEILPNYLNVSSFVFTAGSLNNDLHSALCNTRYFSEPLTKSQITQAYNMLKLQNPPVNNLL